MVDRIRQLLQARQLSSTQFADTIGVARPIVSHILSGRNKPSLEVVQKIIAAFPDLSMPWLLTGQGTMLAAEVAPAPSAADEDKPTRRHSRPVTTPTDTTPAPSAVAAEVPLEAPIAPPAPVAAPVPPLAPEPVATAAPVQPVAAPASLVAQLPAQLLSTPKTIRRVLIFYSDGTFTDFSPATEGI